MATAGGKKRLPAKVSLPRGNVNPYNVPLDVASIRRKTGEDIMGWIAACVLIALLLPLGGMLYLDILDAKHETRRALEKLEKIEQRIERKERDKNRKEPDSVSDNPIFDRVRRPIQVSVSKPTELG